MVALDSDYGKIVFHKIHPEALSIADYINIWEHTIPIDNYEYSRQFTPECHYVYVIMHMMNHFLVAGTGIRSIMDVWVMNNYYSHLWNREKIERILSDFGLYTFEKYALALADKWFDLADVKYIDRKLDQYVLDKYESYILDSGTYGNSEHSISNKIDEKGGMGSRLIYLMKRAFPPYKIMKNVYPILGRLPLLLPFMYICRCFETVIKRKDNIKSVTKKAFSINTEKLRSQRELINILTK